MLRKKKNSIALLIAAAMGCSGLFDLKAEEFSNNVWFNVDAFEKESKAQQQQVRALWNLPTARAARMALMEQQHRQVEKLTAFMLEHNGKDEKISPLAAYERAWNDVYAAARRDAKRALESEAVLQMLDAADDLDENAWLDTMTPELVRGLIYALEEQYDCFDFRDDGRDARRAELLGKALAKEGWTQGMDDEQYKTAQQKETLKQAAFLMSSGVSGSTAFKTAWFGTHASSGISSFNRVVGPVVWSGPGTPADLSDLDPEYVKKMVEEAKKIVAATKAVASAYQQSRHGAAGASAAPSPVAPPSHGGAAGGGGGAGGGSVGGSAAKPVDYSAIFRLLATATPETPAPVDVDEAPGGNVVWKGSTSVLKDGASTTFNAYSVSPKLDVDLQKVWRPYDITVDDTDIKMTIRPAIGETNPKFKGVGEIGYAIAGSGYISDYINGDGTVHPTTITKKGDGILVLANGLNDYSGGTDVQGGVLYVADQGSVGTGEIKLHDNTAMWVNFTWNRDYTSSFRNPEISNDIRLTDGASATISYGEYVYRTVLDNDTSRIWRNMYLTGNLTGAADTNLYLKGYTSRRVNSSSAAPSFTRVHLGGSITVPEEIWYSGFVLDRMKTEDPAKQFYGTVHLQNQTSTSLFGTTKTAVSGTINDSFKDRWTGAVKVTLNDDLLDHAVLDMTREYSWMKDSSVGMTADYNKLLLTGAYSGGSITPTALQAVKDAYTKAGGTASNYGSYALRQTYTNTAIVNAETSIGELRADLLGVTQDTYVDAVEYSEAFEVKHVRVVATERDAHLTLGRDYAAGTQGAAGNVSWYSGTMGLAGLMYGAKDGVDYLTTDKNDVLNVNTSKAGTATSSDGLSLTKEGNNIQNIHTADLHNLTVQSGTLGFNNVKVGGNLFMNSDATLRVGVNDGVWKTAAQTTLEIGEKDGSHSHRFTVVTKDAVDMTSPITRETKPVPLAARVEGQLTMHAGTQLEFMVENLGQDTGDRKVIIPVSITNTTDLSTVGTTGINYLKEHSLLQVAGTTGVIDAAGNAANTQGVLILNQGVAISLDGVNFLREKYSDRTYFLAAADKIIVDGETVADGHASDFASRIVTLGYGFYGIISSIDGHGYYDDGVYKEYTGSSYLDQDFLVLKVAADPTRSWTGSTIARGQQGSDKQGAEIDPWLGTVNTWKALPKDKVPTYTDYKASAYKDLTDPQWKENQVYTDGVSVKFGNLYMPEAWAEFLKKNPGATIEDFKDQLDSERVTKVDDSKRIFSPNGHGNGIAMRNETGDILYGKDGSAYFNEDGSKFLTPDGLSAHYEHVMIDGTVRPGYVTVNSDYLLETADGYVNMTDDTNYVFTDVLDADGKVVRKGCIADATAADMEGIYKNLLGADLDEGVKHDLANWHTGLAKGGTGTLVMDTENTYSGGSLLRGGLTVMRNKWALGMENPTKKFTDADAKGGRIEMAYGAGVMVDYIDSYFNQADVIQQAQLTNDLTITHMADFDNTKATGDAQLMNRFDAAFIVNTLSSYDDAILTLRGASLKEGTNRKADSKGQIHDFFSYADYVITNPVNAYGTIRMAGYLQGNDGRVLNADGSAYKYGGGNVQLTISGHDAAEKNPKILWNHTTIDLSLNGGNKNVLAIETRFLHNEDGTVTENDGSHTIRLTLGTLKDDGMSGDNACVINDASSERIGVGSKYNYLAELILSPSTDTTFSGNVGFGIGQNAEGAAMPSRGYISLTKTGTAIQRIGKAKLLDLTIGEVVNGEKYSGGMLHIAKALSARSISTTVGAADRILVGDVDEGTFSHTLVVGNNGILAFETTLSADPLKDLQPMETASKYGMESSYMLLENGATVTASGNWKATKAFAIQGGAEVTFNTHEYRMDPTISSTMETYGKVAEDLKAAFNDSHIIWLKEGLVGDNVTLKFNNEQMSAGATEEELGTAQWNGYVIARDFNKYTFTSGGRTVQYGLEGKSSIDITDKTIVQLSGDAKADNGISYTITGTDAALQFLDANSSMLSTSGSDSYVKNATLADGGRIIFGGASAANSTTNTKGNTQSLNKDITADADVVISQRKAGQTATVTNVAHTTKNVTENGVTYETTISGNDSARAQIQHAEMTVKKESDVNNTRVQKADVVDTLVSLQEKCTVTMEDVLVNVDSKILGVGAATEGLCDIGEGATAVPLSKTVTDEKTVVQSTLSHGEVKNLGKGSIYQATIDQMAQTDVGGTGLTLGMTLETLQNAYNSGCKFIAVQVTGSGQFLYESAGVLNAVTITGYDGKTTFKGTDVNPDLDPNFVVKVVSSDHVADVLGVPHSAVSNTLLYIEIPEPATALLSLFALAGMAARRRRK